MSKLQLYLLVISLIFSPFLTAADDLPVVRVGVLKFGTVNWELEVIKKRNLDIANDFKIEVIPLGSKNATHVAHSGPGP